MKLNKSLGVRFPSSLVVVAITATFDASVVHLTDGHRAAGSFKQSHPTGNTVATSIMYVLMGIWL
jgi:hypothetical protein